MGSMQEHDVAAANTTYQKVIAPVPMPNHFLNVGTV